MRRRAACASFAPTRPPRGADSADFLQIASARAFGAVDDVESDLLTLLQCIEVDSGQLSAVKEDLIAVIRAHETKTTIRNDLLDSTSSHGLPSQDIC